MLLVENQQYDNSVAYGYLYQMVINISGVYYLYYSADPFFIYENSGNIYEAFNGVNTYRAINQSGVFINPQKMVPNSGSTELSQDYIAWNTARNLDQFVYSNFDILKWGTSELLVSGIWKEPKTNWIIDDKFNYTDYNRIKNNIEYAYYKTDKVSAAITVLPFIILVVSVIYIASQNEYFLTLRNIK